jgi:imidazole glycerol-phosphate synthase subunit HisF
MLKKRITALLVVKDGRVVQSIGFKCYLPVGRLSVAVEFLNRWGIDEIVIVDIDATPGKRRPDFELIREVSKKNFVPLTVGGGIRGVEDMRTLVHSGADKVAINTVALDDPRIIEKAAQVFGNQCIVVSMDVRKARTGIYEVYGNSGKTPTGKDPVSWAKEIEALGAGEILLNSVDQDGSKQGYDLNLIQMVAQAVHIPVIACGGVGSVKDFWQGATQTNASALAAGNFFHFTEHSPLLVKSYLFKHKVDVRLDTYANYKGLAVDDTLGRLLKKPDEELDKLRFMYQPEEVI